MIDWNPKPVAAWEPPHGEALAAIAARANKLAEQREQACRRYYPAEKLAGMVAHDVVSCALTNVVNPVARSQRYGAVVALVGDLFRREVDLVELAKGQREMTPDSAFLADLAESLNVIVHVCELTGRDLGDDGQRVVDGLRRYAELLTDNKINT